MEKRVKGIHKVALKSGILVKRCATCLIEKDINCFTQSKRKSGKEVPIAHCIDCLREKYAEQKNEQYQSNKEVACARSRKRYQENKADIRKVNNEREKERRKSDPKFRLQKSVSVMIRIGLKSGGGSKDGKSCWSKLSYTPQMLQDHIVSQFSLLENLDNNGKVWMTLNNYGRYNSKTWDPLDPLTWTWQVDHIKPVADFHFASMDDKEFQECYSLENQRPLSAKQNFEDGVKRTRHKKPRKKKDKK